MAIALTAEQKLAVEARGGDLLVSAAAGSGKTRVLVERLMGRVCGPERRDVDEFLVLTFTKAAAGEMRSRILRDLSARLAQDPKNAHLRRQMTLIYQAEITTIDAYCAALVRENAHLCGLSGDFRIADETETALLQDQILEDLIEEGYEDEEPEFLLLCDTLALGRDDRRLREIVLNLYEALQSHADPMRWVDQVLLELDPENIGDPGETRWGRELMEDAAAQADFAVRSLGDALEEIRKDGALLNAYGTAFQADQDAAYRIREAAKKQHWDQVIQALTDTPVLKLKALRGYEDKAMQNRLKNCRDRWKKIRETLQERFDSSAEEVREDLRALYPVAQGLFRLLRQFEERFQEEKRRRNLADFADLEHAAAGLLRAPDGCPSELAFQLSTRYAEVMVDEYQDINECQDAILSALGRENLFYVGDMKQSIYRFRLADPRIFLEKYLWFPLTEQPELSGASKVLLNRNFRSRASVLEACNFLFSRIMRSETGELDYTKKEALYPGRDFGGEDPPPELLIADCTGSRALPEEQRVPSAQVEAALVARRIRQLLDEGALISDGGSFRPVEPGDIVILLRSPAGRAPAFEAALRQEGVPCVSPKKEEHWTGIERAVVLSLLQCIDNPRQDVPLVSVLRSPVFSFLPDELAEIRQAAPEACFFDALSACRETMPKVAAFLDFLERLRLLAPDLTVEALLRLIYDETELPSIVGTLPDGTRRRQDLEALLELARSFESTSYKGLFSFLRFLEKQIESGKELQPSLPEAGSSAVRIMSIHRSKGLEFPVVFLSGLGSRFNRQDLTEPVLLHPELGAGFRRLDRERMVEWNTAPRQAIALRRDRELLAEEMRLMYVAMTRPTDRLLLSGAVPDLSKLVEKAAAAYAGGVLSSEEIRAASTPMTWVLQALVSSQEGADFPELDEGLGLPTERPSCGWRISVASSSELMGGEEETAPLPEEGHAPTIPPEQADRVRSMLSWRYPHEAASMLPSKVTATQLKGRFLDEESAQEAQTPVAEEAPLPLRRPAFLREGTGLTPAERGIATHLAMQFLDFSRCQSLEQVKKELERLRQDQLLSPAQADAVSAERLWHFFESDLGQRVLHAERVLREFKFSLLAPAETWFSMPEGESEELLLQGVIDCAFLEKGAWTILDFKTDRIRPGEEAARAARYTVQLETYAAALKRITGIPAAEKTVYFFSTGKAVTLG